jgi:uncharacterized membrane protein
MRLFGHPVHPIVVAFPIALLGLTPILDALSLLGVMADGAGAAYLCEAAGLIGGGLAILTGFADFVKIPQSEKAAAKTAIIHASLGLSMLGLFGIAFALRGGRMAAATPGPLALEAAGAAVLAVTGWFGGHLVFGHGVGVDTRNRPAAD